MKRQKFATLAKKRSNTNINRVMTKTIIKLNTTVIILVNTGVLHI